MRSAPLNHSRRVRPPRGATSRLLPAGVLTAPLVLVSCLLIILLIAGGASRADAFGQVVVRAAAWTVIAVAIVGGWQASDRSIAHRPIWIILLGAITLTAAQLVPLPPAIWQALPGRDILADAARLSGQAQPWRPWSIAPDATINALSSLVLPLAVLLLLRPVEEDGHRWLVGTLLLLVWVSALVGLVQFSGTRFDSVFVNDTVGAVSGLFANRNHFALFSAFGIVLAPVWAFNGEGRPSVRVPIALSLIALLALIILASGSRAGMLTGVIALVAGAIIVRPAAAAELDHYPKRAIWLAAAAGVALLVILVWVSVAANRAASIDRALDLQLGSDFRGRALPTVLLLVRSLFPIGGGFGSFNTTFRIFEPAELLDPSYYNHAHNDFLEIAGDAGIAGILLLAAGVGWWAWQSLRVWRATVAPGKGQSGAARDLAVARLGSVMILLVLIASFFEYPARTPMIMATIVLAAVWLAQGSRFALPVLPNRL